MKAKNTNKLLSLACLIMGVILCGIYYFFFTSMTGKTSEQQYIYIDEDDTADSVCTKLKSAIHPGAMKMSAFATLLNHSSYPEHIKTGKYDVGDGAGAFSLFKRLKSGQQTAVNLTIPSVRTMEDMARVLSHKLMADSTSLADAFTDSNLQSKYGYDSTTIACLFIPNTYDVYWNISPEKLMDRMEKEKDKFWNADRTAKAQAMGLTENEVVTLASIIDEETNNNAEKPMVAGMYYNRLQQQMPLQADPTVKFALKDFAMKRIYNKHLGIDSPYNTYKNEGLPPGPIRVPTIAGIDAVLDYTHHNYLYMCAKEDFSGTHNFAATYSEHLKNAAKYAKALNERGIN